MFLRAKAPRKIHEGSKRHANPKGTWSNTHDIHHEAANVIQRSWRGYKARWYAAHRRERQKPLGFYTHSVVRKLGADKRHQTKARVIWQLFEEPMSSREAVAVTVAIVISILLSIAVFILETVPEVDSGPGTWLALECFCTTLFTLEFLTRLAVCHEGGISQLQFFTSPLNICDLVAIAPFYVEFLLHAVGVAGASAMKMLRMVRLIRILRLFKLGRYASGVRLMVAALKDSIPALTALAFMLFVGVVVFASAIYHLERMSCPTTDGWTVAEATTYQEECDHPFHRGVSPTFGLCCDDHGSAADFPSILDGAWWAMVTMTSVGYGDVVPRTTQGKMIGIVAMLLGMMLITLPVGIVVQKFQVVHEEHCLDEKRSKASARMAAPGHWALEPNSSINLKMRHLKLKDPVCAAAMTGFLESLESVWCQREQIGRERSLQFEKHRSIQCHLEGMLAGLRANCAPPDCEPAGRWG